MCFSFLVVWLYYWTTMCTIRWFILSTKQAFCYQEAAFQELVLLYTEDVNESDVQGESEFKSLQVKIYERIPIPDLLVNTFDSEITMFVIYLIFLHESISSQLLRLNSLHFLQLIRLSFLTKSYHSVSQTRYVEDLLSSCLE